MPVYDWQRSFDPAESLERSSAEWDEVWDVGGYVQAANPAFVDLVSDRPDLAPGQPHATVAYAYVDRFTPERQGDTDGWTVTVRYKIVAEQQPDVSPLSRPAEISVETETIEVPTFKRGDGSLILNTAGGLIYGATRPVTRLIFNVEKNVASVPAWVLAYSDNAVNSDAVTIDGLSIPAGKLQLQKVRATPRKTEVVNGAVVVYRTLSFALVYDPRGWERKVYNRGLYQKFEGRVVPCFDSDKEPTSEPMFLDSAGAQLPLPLTEASVIEVDATTKTDLAFSSLPLT